MHTSSKKEPQKAVKCIKMYNNESLFLPEEVRQKRFSVPSQKTVTFFAIIVPNRHQAFSFWSFAQKSTGTYEISN